MTETLDARQREILLALLLEEEGVEADTAPILRREPGGEKPLSFAQQRLWFLQQLDPGTAAYNVPAAARLVGHLDVDALSAALSEIVRRHESLRTVIEPVLGSARQRILDAYPIAIPLDSLEEVPEAERWSTALARATEAVRQPFDLARDVLVRPRLFRLKEGDHLLVLAMHHIASDLWSRGILLRELSVLYRGFRTGQPSPLPVLKVQYSDYARWQRDLFDRGLLRAQLEHWRERLAGLPRLELPTDQARGAILSSNGGHASKRLDPELSEALRALARGEGRTLFMTLLAVFASLLERYSGQIDLPIGTPVANRKRTELEPLIGFFLNTLVLRLDATRTQTFRELLASVGAAVTDALAHDDLPFEKLVEELQPERSLAQTPLFQVIFSFGNANPGRLDFAGLEATPVSLEDRTAKVELNVVFGDDALGLSGLFEYNADLFEPATIDRLACHYVVLAKACTDEPEAPLSELAMLDAGERDQIVVGLNRTDRGYPDTADLGSLLRSRAQAIPDVVALVAEDLWVSYGELDRRTNRLARALGSLGVGPDVRVGVCANRSIEMVLALVGVVKAGGAYVPIDPDYPAERREFMLTDSGVRVLLIQEQLRADLMTSARCLALDEAWREIETFSDQPHHPGLELSNLAYVIYTSGSTGRPKGAMVPHGGIANRLLWMQEEYGLGPEDRVLQKTPFSFDVSVWEFFWTLMMGARLVMAKPGGHREPSYLSELIEREGITTLHFVPSMLRAFVDEPGAAAWPSLRRVICSGEALGADLVERWYSRSAAPLHNLYGPTEASVDVTYWACRSGDRRSVPIGLPISNLRIHIVDAYLQLLPFGVPGELLIVGVGLGRGYLERPTLTAERFIPNPFARSEGERAYRTGDLARYRVDGAIEYLGRIDLQVKVRGFRIELGEIESALLEHPKVGEAAVLAVQERAGDARLVAYLVSEETKSFELREFLKARLPEFMLPAAWVFLDRLPLSPNGKLDRKQLPAPGKERPQLEQEIVDPETDAEEILVGVWAQVIGIDRVGVRDNFFALGGDSMRSLQAVVLARERGLDISLQDIFQYQTVAELARRASAATSERPAPSAPFSLIDVSERTRLPSDLEDAYPLSYLQAGMLYHMALKPEDPPYHNVDSWLIEGVFDRATFQRAVDRMVARHPVLRTSFDLASFSESIQLVHQTAALPVVMEDISSLDDADQEAVVDAWIAEEKRRVFGPADLPQLRCKVHLRGARRFELTVTENHALWDGWSLHSSLAELFEDYLADLGGEPRAPEPPLAVTYRDFVALERETIASPECREFWRLQLEGATLSALPSWPTPVPSAGRRIQSHRVVISTELASDLRRVARRAAVPLKSLLLAAHLRVLALASGSADVLAGIVANGRPEVPDGDRLRGLFLNALPFRMVLEPSSWLDLMRRVFDAERRMPPYRRYPLAQIHKDLGVDTLFDLVFNYIQFHVVDRVLDRGDLKVLRFKSREGTSFKIQVVFAPAEEGRHITLSLEHDTTRTGRDQAQVLGGWYQRTLAAMAAWPDSTFDAAPLLSAPELAQVTREWSGTAAVLPSSPSLYEVFATTARRIPEALAVVVGTERVSYAELDRRVAAIASRLADLDLDAEARIGILLSRDVDLVAAILAVLQVGAAYVPIDPKYPRDRNRFMLDDSGAAVLLTDPETADAIGDWHGRRLDVKALSGGPPVRARRIDPAGLAYLIYTSGSTGRPKGVEITHGSATAFIAWAVRSFSPSELSGVLASTSICFDLSIFELFAPLAVGGVVVLADHVLALPDLPARDQVTLVNTVPSAMSELLFKAPLPPSARTVILAGEALPRSLADRVFSAGATRLCNLYGPTEDTTYSTGDDVAVDSADVTIGRAIAGGRTFVFDPWGTPVGVGVAGALHLGGEGLARGYHRRPGLTAERFVPDAWSGRPGARLYATGDLARFRHDGRIEFLGRSDRQVKVRGFRIELGEIESTLVAHPEVAEAAVVVQHAERGPRLIAWLAPRHGGEPARGALWAHLRERLPDYMLPSELGVLAELPKTANGKVDRRALPTSTSAFEAEREIDPPTSPIEARLVELWREVLGHERIGVRDNFFSLGGDSILILRLVSRARRLGLGIEPRELFAAPTIAALASSVVEVRPTSVPAATFEGGSVWRLSPMQESMLVFHLLNPGSGVYFNQEIYSFDEEIDVAALRRAWEMVFARHSILRARFEWERHDEPIQIIEPRVEVPLFVADWRNLEPSEAEVRWNDLLISERRALDLARAPIARLSLVFRGGGRSILAWSWHHALLDAWSVDLLSTEWTSLYAELRAGREPVPEPAPQYREFLAWLDRREPGAGDGFWRSYLAGFEAPTSPALLAPPNPVLEARAGRRGVALSKTETDLLAEACREIGISIHTAVVAAWALALSLWSGDEDVLFGMVSQGRPSDLAEVESIAGLFIATVPLRVRATPFQRLGRWLVDLQRNVGSVREFEHVPLSRVRLASEVAPGRPLFESLVVLQRRSARGRESQELLHGARGLDQADQPLALFAYPGPELALRLSYDTTRVDVIDAGRLLDGLATLLVSFSGRSELPLSSLPKLAPSERHQTLVEWNDTSVAADEAGTLPDLFRAQALRTPQRIAVLHRGRELTYAELNRASDISARVLAARGLGPDSLIAIVAERSADFLVAILGAMKAGAAYLPLDPAHPPLRWTQVLRLAGVRLLVAEAEFEAAALAAVEPLGEAAPPVVQLADVMGGGSSPDVIPLAPLASNLAYVIFTSGSTGLPKGAMLEHRGMVNHLYAKVEDLQLGPEDAIAQTASQCFDISIWQFLAALLVGGRTVILDDETSHEPLRLAHAIRRLGITVAELVPSLLRVVVEGVERGDVEREEFLGLRWIIPTGEALPPDLARRWFALFPSVPLVNAYGPTECSDDVSHFHLVCAPAEDAESISIGRTLREMALVTVGRDFEPTPIGVPGELCVAGAGVGRGYLNDPGRTAEAFVPDPFTRRPGARMYRTGDLARRQPCGDLDFLGRIDHQVKLRGHRIELGEIESVLSRHPAVSEAAVLIRALATGDLHLVAYLVTFETETFPSLGEIETYLAERLPAYMVPSRFVTLQAMPLTRNGKLDRNALPMPDVVSDQPSREPLAPRNGIEEILAGIWCEVLGLERVGIDQDFFELGGHSLRMIQITSRVRRAFGVEVSLTQLFELPTVGGLAAVVGAARAASENRVPVPRIERASRDLPLPLSFSQARQWFLDQLEPGNPAYNLPASIGLPGRVNAAAISAALSEVLRRHEVLRTRFASHGGEPHQEILAAAPLPLSVVDCGGLSGDMAYAAARVAAMREQSLPFDLAQGPLLRAWLVLGPTESRLFLTLHHIVTDGWSMTLLIRELSILYQAALACVAPSLAPLPVQYADFAAWQRSWLEGPALEDLLDYWRGRLAGAPPVLDLPLDRPRPPIQTHRGARRRLGLGPELLAAVRGHGQREGMTQFMVLLGAWVALLFRHTHDEDISVGTYTAGRGLPEIEGLIGFFVNTLVLRMKPSGAIGFGRFLEQVREVTLGAFAHEDLPFEKLLEEIRPERSLAHTPLFQVMLEFQNTGGAGSGPRPVVEGDDSFQVGRAHFDLTLWFLQIGDQLVASLGWNRDLFDDSTAERWGSRFAVLLAGALAAPGQRLSELPLLGAEERAELLGQRSGGPPSAYFDALSRFEAEARRRPRAPALRSHGIELSYGDLDRAADLLATRLVRAGVRAENLVAVSSARSPELIAALLGIWKAGAAYLPIDPTYPIERKRAMLEDAGVAWIVASSSAPTIHSSKQRMFLLDDLLSLGVVEDEGAEAPVWTAPETLAYAIYTSGSSGRPKSVGVSRSALGAYVASAIERFGLTDDDRVLQFASISFDTAAEEIFPALASGAALVLRDDEMLNSPAVFLRRCGELGVTVLDLPTVYWGEIAAVLAAGETLLPETLRLVIIGGERATLDRLQLWQQGAGTKVRLVNTYGPTEATIVATEIDLTGETGPFPWGPPIGRPIRGITVDVVAPGGGPVPVGVPGELAIGGVGLARGYLDRPDVTAERFVPDALGTTPGGRLYRTGDLARIRPDGALEFLGRIDRQVKVRGFRIELGEIEAALRGLAGVTDAVVTVVPGGSGDLRLAAYLVAADRPSASELRRSLAENLPEHMLPASFDFLAALPITANGKVNWRALPAPNVERPTLDASFSEPATEMEQLLASIWSDVLGLARVGVRDNFFELGGHSLLATQVLARIRERLDVELSLVSFFEAPTVEVQAVAVEEILLDRLEAEEE